MGNVYIIGNFEETPIAKYAKTVANFILNRKIYEANIYSSMEVPEQLKQQVDILARQIIINTRRKNG